MNTKLTYLTAPLLTAILLVGCQPPLPPQEPPASPELREHIARYRDDALRENVARDSYAIRENSRAYSEGMGYRSNPPVHKKTTPKKKSTPKSTKDKSLKPTGMVQSYV